MKGSVQPNGNNAEEICLACGLCCNGVIFADVKLLSHEDAQPLLSMGMPLLRATGKKHDLAKSSVWRFLQPCSAFDGCRCRIYSSRPSHCRRFECLQLKKLRNGSITKSVALAHIRAARNKAERVDKLLQTLADSDPGLSLAERFRRMAQRLGNEQVDSKTASIFGELTLAFHDLNVILQEKFYPAPSA